MCCGHSTPSMGPVRVQVFHSMMNGALTGLDDVGRSVVHVRLFDGGELSFPLSVLVGDGCIQPIEGNMLIFGSTFFQHFAVTFTFIVQLAVHKLAVKCEHSRCMEGTQDYE